MDEAVRQRVRDCAFENFKGGLNCAESVCDALLRAGALEAPGELVAMCVGFGGGIGLSGHTCGALSAAVLANGAVHGRRDPWSVPDGERGREVAERYYRRYNRLVEDFAAQNGGAVTCREICAPFGDFHGKERRVNCMKLVARTAELAYACLCVPQEEAFALPYGENMGGNR